MPRGPRLDAFGTLHHVIVRGIEKRNIVDMVRGNCWGGKKKIQGFVEKGISTGRWFEIFISISLMKHWGHMTPISIPATSRPVW
jgi:hypothetical protein